MFYLPIVRLAYVEQFRQGLNSFPRWKVELTHLQLVQLVQMCEFHFQEQFHILNKQSL